MSSTLLTEYRCTCGKLLFKGLLCQCVVEVKCRRCGAITSWGHAEESPWALVESDADTRITSVSGHTREVFDCERDYLLGRSLADVFPLIRDAAEGNKSPALPVEAYDLSNNVLVLNDGRERVVDSRVIPQLRDGRYSGYRIFAVPKRV